MSVGKTGLNRLMAYMTDDSGEARDKPQLATNDTSKYQPRDINYERILNLPLSTRTFI